MYYISNVGNVKKDKECSCKKRVKNGKNVWLR